VYLNLDQQLQVSLNRLNIFVYSFQFKVRRQSAFIDRQTSARVKTARSRLQSHTSSVRSSTPSIQTKRRLTMSSKSAHT